MNKIANELLSVAKAIVAFGGNRAETSSYYKNFLEKKQAYLVDVKGADIRVYYWNGETHGNQEYFAMTFVGRAIKPTWTYRFKTEQNREDFTNKAIKEVNEHAERKEVKRQERKEFQHNLKVGDILSASWGYDQTNQDYYQVIRVIDKKIVIREIASKQVGVDRVVADKDNFIGEAMLKQPSSTSKGDAVVKISSYEYAFLWDGKPEYETPIGMGH